MSPVLEQGSFILKQLPELILPERLVAGKQDLVVGALDGGNAVDLNETEIVDELQQTCIGQGAPGWSRQPLPARKIRRAALFETGITMV
jgi:hypothetical protein